MTTVAPQDQRTELKDLLERLRLLMPELRDRHAVDSLEIFGSRARGEELGDSDLDLLVTFTEKPGLLELIGLEQELGDRLGLDVDLVMRGSLKPRIRDRVLAEAIAV